MQYCSIIENFDLNKENNKFKNLLVSLLDLYTKALDLPEVETENDEASIFDISVPQINFEQYDHYRKVFDPFHLEEPVGASLSDDTLDIYKDVKRGILIYEKNDHIEAIWHWKLNFEIHWGSHAVNAIRALHSVNFDDIY